LAVLPILKRTLRLANRLEKRHERIRKSPRRPSKNPRDEALG
jgi:hypothetical protein